MRRVIRRRRKTLFEGFKDLVHEKSDDIIIAMILVYLIISAMGFPCTLLLLTYLML